jgi:uncharacterized protein DUF3857
MCTHFRSLLSLVGLALLVSILSTAQSTGVAANPDYSKDGVIVEHYTTRVVYDADGTGTREIAAMVRMQAEAGVHNFAVLGFPYANANENVELGYVRVRKPDGTVVATPANNIQDMPAEVTRVAPMYSDLREKHVTVKALSEGDVLEYMVRYRTVKPQIPGHFWFEYVFAKGNNIEDEELEVSVPRNKYLKVSSPGLTPQVKDESVRRIYSWKITADR